MARESPSSATRNIGIMAHIDAGKTTTTERILFYTGRQLQDRRGPRGRRDHGLDGAGAGARHHDHRRPRRPSSGASHRINLIDTPGHVDFTDRGRALAARARRRGRACSTPSPASSRSRETVWRQADRYRVPRIAFVNKCDRVGADSERCVARDPRAPRREPDRHPAADRRRGRASRGVVDLVAMKTRASGDDEELGAQVRRRRRSRHAARRRASRARDAMIEAIAELDDELMAKFVDGTRADRRRAARRRCAAPRSPCKAVPVLVRRGLQEQGRPAAARRGRRLPAVAGRRRRRSRASTPTTGKPATRRGRRRRAVRRARVQDHERRVRRSAHLRPRLLRHARRRRRPSTTRPRASASASAASCACTPTSARTSRQIEAGNIAAAVGLRVATTGDTLCDEKHADPARARCSSPTPVISQAIEPETKADQDKLGTGARRGSPSRIRPSASTPTPRPARPSSPAWASSTSRSSSTACSASSRSRPTSASRRSPTARPSPQPVERGVQAHPADRRPRPVRPRQAASSSRTSAARASRSSTRSPAASSPTSSSRRSRRASARPCERGVLAGFPMIDVKVTLVDGSYHDVDSLGDGLQDRRLDGASRGGAAGPRPILLEPVMAVEVVTPEEYVGDVIGDLNARRGKVAGMDAHGWCTDRRR